MEWLLPNRRTSSTSNWRSDAITNFDKFTGQVYIETTAPIQSSGDQGWPWRRPAAVRDFSRSKRSQELQGGCFRGAKSLQDAAIECVMENISGLTLEAVECLPTKIVRRLLREIDSRGLMCFNIWKLFTKSLRSHSPMTLDLLCYKQTIRDPRSPLEVYTIPLNAPSFDFITFLSITNTYPIADLIKLSKIVNLGVLEILNVRTIQVDGGVGVGDRLIRAWYMAALDENAFQVLRILRLWNHEDLTEKSFVYLNSFKSLAVYDVRGCAFHPQSKLEARKLGWTPTLDGNHLALVRAACNQQTAVIKTVRRTDSQPPQTYTRKDKDALHSQPKQSQEMPAQSWSRGNNSISDPTVDEKYPPQFDTTFGSSNITTLDAPNPRRTSQSFESCALDTYITFSGIGKLRNDVDLAKAGVVSGSQVLVCDELIKSIPMMCLRLGDDLTLSSPTSPSLSFLRIKTPHLQNGSAGRKSPESKDSTLENGSGQGAEMAQEKSGKSRTSGVMRNRKRKIEEILGSFQ